MNATGDTMLGEAVGSDGLCREHGGACWDREEREMTYMADVVFYGIAFVFLGLCLLYVRAADKL
jgi:hypothetical protein